MELPLSQDLVDKVHSDAAKVLTQRTNGAATIHVTIPLTKSWKWMQNKNPSLESSCQFWLPMAWSQHPKCCSCGICAWETCGSFVEEYMDQLIGSRSQTHHNHKWRRTSIQLMDITTKPLKNTIQVDQHICANSIAKQRKRIASQVVSTETTRPGSVTISTIRLPP